MGVENYFLRKKIEKKIAKKFPGKTIHDVTKMYDEFCAELNVVKGDDSKTLQDLLNCLIKYEDVLDIMDMFRSDLQGKNWRRYRKSVEYAIYMGNE